MRIGRNKVLRAAMQVGEIAASAAGDQYLLADALGPFQDRHTASATTGFHRAHESGRAGAQDDDVVMMMRKIIQSSDYPSFGGIRVACSPPTCEKLPILLFVRASICQV